VRQGDREESPTSRDDEEGSHTGRDEGSITNRGDDKGRSRQERKRSTRLAFFDVRDGDVQIHGGNFQFQALLPQPISDTPDWEDRKNRGKRVETFLHDMQYYRHPLGSSHLAIIRKILCELSPKSILPSPENALRRQSTLIVPSAVRPIFTFGSIPMISMAVGVAFLTASAILLAAASQMLASEVWISCTGGLLFIIALSLLPFSSFLLREIKRYLEPNEDSSIRSAA